MNRRAKLQLRLQKPSRPLRGRPHLLRFSARQYLAKGTKICTHWNTDVITAVSIPIIAGLVAWGTHRMRKKLAKRKKRHPLTRGVPAFQEPGDALRALARWPT